MQLKIGTYHCTFQTLCFLLIPNFRYCLPAAFLRQSQRTLPPSLYIGIATLPDGVGTSITLLHLTLNRRNT